MLSKAKGQILRVAAAIQVLFGLQHDHHLITSTTCSITHVSEDAISAAIDFIDVCFQHMAYMAGRGIISEDIAAYLTGTHIIYDDTLTKKSPSPGMH